MCNLQQHTLGLIFGSVNIVAARVRVLEAGWVSDHALIQDGKVSELVIFFSLWSSLSEVADTHHSSSSSLSYCKIPQQ